MEQKDGRGAICPPRWESFVINSNELGGDFPAGPYNRMISKLYGTSNESSEPVDRCIMDNLYSNLGSADGQPSYPIYESRPSKSPNRPLLASVHHRQDSMANSLHPGSQLLHGPDEMRQKDASGRPGLSGSQFSNGVKHEDEATRYFSLGAHPNNSIEEQRQHTSSSGFYFGHQHIDKSNQADDSVRFGQTDTQHMERLEQVYEPSMLASKPPQLNDLADIARVDPLPDRSVTGGGPPADIVPQTRLGKVPETLLSIDGQSKEHAEKTNVGGAPAGVIFMCNKTTKQTCFHYSLFGLPASQFKLVKRIVPGTKLFLFMLDSRELHGIFEATSYGGLNLDLMAFGGAFPSQVRFRICMEGKPLAEKDFKKAIEDNYFAHNKFKNELTSQQVSALMQLFCPEGFVEMVQKHENLLLGHSNAGGMMDCSALNSAECQSEKSMDISPHGQKSPTVEQSENIYGKERGFLMNSSVANAPSRLDSSNHYLQNSFYSSIVQPSGCSVQNYILNERADEGGNFHLKERHQDSLHPSHTPSILQSSNGGLSGPRFSHRDLERRHYQAYDAANASDQYISNSRSWFGETMFK